VRPQVAIVRIEELYDVPAETLWRHVVRYDTLETMMSGRLVRVKCPRGEEQAGHEIVLVFRLLGLVSVGSWKLKVLARDDARRRLASEESGTFVRRWAHEIAVDEVGERGSRLRDTIEIDAGVLTPLIASKAFGSCQRPRRFTIKTPVRSDASFAHALRHASRRR
jgi:hypothetical protein